MTNKELHTMDIQQVLKYLPHRYPFLLIDRVLDYTVGENLKALKNVTINEPFFSGHFPEMPVMPGVLVLEAMAQATGILAFLTTQTKPGDGSTYYLVGVDSARFKRPVLPGDQLIFDVAVDRVVHNIWKFKTVASVDGDVVSTAQIMCAGRETTS